MSYIRKRKRNGYIYLEEVKSIRVDGKVKQKYLRYVGKEVDNKTIAKLTMRLYLCIFRLLCGV